MDLYFKILHQLSLFGINEETEISEVFNDYLLSPKEPGDFAFGLERINGIVDFLKIMVENNHISYKNLTPNYNSEHNDNPPKGAWIKPIKINATLTKDGLDYYYNFILKEATLQSYKNQKWVNRITWVISCVSIGIAVYFGLKSNSLTKQVEALQKKVDTITKTKGTIFYYAPIRLDTTKKISTKK